jgi:hypothetical protein
VTYRRDQIRLALLLLLPSVAAYAAHYAIFRDGHSILSYLLMDLGFLFVQGLLVTLVIDQLLNARERETLQKKLNVVIGVFYSHLGTPLLKRLSAFDEQAAELARALVVHGESSREDFAAMRQTLDAHTRRISARCGDLAGLKVVLDRERDFLLRLLENPNLLEHDTFTELLWAVFHMAEELAHRSDLNRLDDADRVHIEGDILRAYELLVREWLVHLEHLKSDYPYLFSLAARTNPFDPNASVEISSLRVTAG